MRCAEFENRVHDLLDERMAPNADRHVQEHARQCPPCRRLLSGFEALVAGCELSEPPALAESFAQQVVARALAPAAEIRPLAELTPAPPRAARRFPAWAMALTAVAATLVVAALGWRAWKVDDKTPVAAGDAGTAKSEILAHDKPALPQVAPQPGNGLAVAIPGVSPNVGPHGQAEPIDDYLALVGAIAPPFPNETPTWVSEVAGGLRPVASSLGGAIEALRRTLPGTREGSRPDKPSAESHRSRPDTQLA